MRLFDSSPTPHADCPRRDPVEVVSLLSDFELFHGLADDQLEVLADQFAVSTARPGQALERQDVAVRRWKLIAAGHAYVAHDGAPIGLLGRGESWSEYSILNQQRSSISVVALSPVTLLSLAEREFFSIPDHSPVLAGRLVARSATSADRMAQPVYRALLGLSQRGVCGLGRVPEPVLFGQGQARRRFTRALGDLDSCGPWPGGVSVTVDSSSSSG